MNSNPMNSGNNPSSSKSGKLPFLHGPHYQIGLSMLLFVRGFIKKLTNFRLESEVKDAIKLDDVVFDEGDLNYTLLQLKRKIDESKKKIFSEHLFGNLTDYSLTKYVCSYVGAKKTSKFNNGAVIKEAIVFTNIPLDADKDGNMKINNLTNYFGYQKQIEVKKVDIDEKNLLYLTKSAKCYKFSTDPSIKDAILKQARTIKTNDHELKDVLPSLTESAVIEALDHIYYFVEQPNDEELFKIVQEIIENHFKIDATDIIRTLKEIITYWVKTKEGLFLDAITYQDAVKFFDQNIIKAILFDVVQLTNACVGRENELKEIRSMLQKKGNCVISQQVSISGLGGIGKTTLAQAFIENYKEDFYNRVIWINSETIESIESSFRRLVVGLKISTQEIDCQNNQFEKLKPYIRSVIQYFKHVSVLFVFDNAEKQNKDASNCLTYFRNLLLNQEYKIYVLITSRDKNFGIGIESLDLDLLKKDEAILMVKHQLNEKSEEALEKLVLELQYFPLALQQAIAYIKEKQKDMKIVDKSFTVTDYIELFKKKTEDLLSYTGMNAFGDKYESTTFTTWNITIDEIKILDFGEQAWKILKIMCFLDSDNINPQLFKYFFKDDQTKQETVEKAILLLANDSLINLTDINKKGCIVNIHRLVQQVVRIKIKEETEQILQEIMNLAFSEDQTLKKLMKGQMFIVWEHVLQYKTIVKNFGTKIDPFGNNALHYCAIFGNLEIINFLVLEEKVDPNIKDIHGGTPILDAAARGHLNVIKLLIEQGANIKAKDGNSNSILHMAALRGQQEVVKFLFEKELDPNETGFNDQTPIFYAAQNGHLTVIKLLIKHGANIRTRDTNFNSVLQIAALNGQEEVVEFLLEKGLDSNITDFNNRTPIFYAARNGHLNVIKRLIELGANIKTRDTNFNSVLHIAALNGQQEVVKFLLEKKLDPNEKGFNGQTPIFYAAQNGHLNVIKCLIEHGANIEVRDEDSDSVLHIAALKGQKEVVKFLLEKGLDPNEKGFNGQTPIFYAAQNGHLNVIKRLIELGANSKAKDEDANSVLHMAAFMGQQKVIEFLIKKGLHLNES